MSWSLTRKGQKQDTMLGKMDAMLDKQDETIKTKEEIVKESLSGKQHRRDFNPLTD